MASPFTAEQLLARADHLDRQVEKWRLNPGYADTIRMEAWALRVAAKVNSPETEDWMAGVPLEAEHQIERWGSAHDIGKTAWDWYWLIGHLAQKAAVAALFGNIEKAKHHTISTAAALLNWHRNLTGESTAMRPGIDPVERKIEVGQNDCA
jgi:hypothetical protein